MLAHIFRDRWDVTTGRRDNRGNSKDILICIHKNIKMKILEIQNYDEEETMTATSQYITSEGKISIWGNCEVELQVYEEMSLKAWVCKGYPCYHSNKKVIRMLRSFKDYKWQIKH